jgi:CRP/FNR family transcriptional regulator, cyclic AMP receptor protein
LNVPAGRPVKDDTHAVSAGAAVGWRFASASVRFLAATRPEGTLDASLLKKIPLFADVPDEELRKVATFATTEEFPEGATVVKEGGYSNHFYAIEEGTVKIERGGEHLADLGPGDVFGEQGLLERQERSASVVATSPLRVIKIEHWELSRMRKSMPQIVAELQRKVEERQS